MQADDMVDRPAGVPAGADRVERRDGSDPAVDPYGVIGDLVAAGVDASRIEVYRIENGDADGTYYVVTLDEQRTAVLTDDTEQHVVWMEGPWPFKATIYEPDGYEWTELDVSLQALIQRVVEWYELRN